MTTVNDNQELGGSDDVDEGDFVEEESETPESEKRNRVKIKFAAPFMKGAEAVVYFRALVEGIESGRLELEHADEQLELTPRGPMSVELKASTKGTRQKLSFEVEWNTAAPESLDIVT